MSSGVGIPSPTIKALVLTAMPFYLFDLVPFLKLFLLFLIHVLVSYWLDK